MDRRGALHFLSAGAVGGGLGLLGDTSPLLASAAVTLPPPRGLPSLKITDIKTILTAPDGIRLVIVKIMTSEPGLYGLGCATFTQRAYVVATAVEQYLKPFLLGRNPDDIEDIWQSSYVSSYWRNGGVLFNAMSGVDEALWDIKAKRAAMPLYQLLGGRCRLGADLYYHASGGEFAEVEDAARKAMELGYRYVRIQAAVPGLATYGVRGTTPATDALDGPSNPTRIWEPGPYVRMVPRLFEHMRVQLGEEVELLHDVHERVTLNQGVNLCKELEKYRPFFIEDPFPPEENEHFRLVRQQCATPIAMGELFNTMHEHVPLISGRLIDYIRTHISQVGGLSMARKVAVLCEFFGVKTAWHGPGDASPIAHATQLALELASYNFGIHEGGRFPKETAEVFKGCPETKKGFLYANEVPGHRAADIHNNRVLHRLVGQQHDLAARVAPSHSRQTSARNPEPARIGSSRTSSPRSP
jgi:mannonate dehydratase